MTNWSPLNLWCYLFTIYTHTQTHTYTHNKWIHFFLFISSFSSFATQRIFPNFFFTWYLGTRAWLNFFFFSLKQQKTWQRQRRWRRQNSIDHNINLCISIINVAMFNVFFFLFLYLIFVFFLFSNHQNYSNKKSDVIYCVKQMFISSAYYYEQ
jgi:hypothetical protein